MAGFTLYCREGKSKKGQWYFEEVENGINVNDPDEVIVAWFTHQDAEARFVLPSVWRNFKKVEFKLDDKSTILFEADPRSVARLRQYLDRALLSQGSGAIRGLRKKGWFHLLCGLGGTLGGFLGLILCGRVLHIDRRWVLYLFAGLILLGLGDLAWGISTVLRAGRLRRILTTDDTDNTDKKK
ncbi:MAG: hypothetical protein JO112_06380 [Planctomycetes bacterium]|nr:hypothetical protein [Planctomycetota bacterium]